MRYKLTRKRIKIIIKNLKLYCDEIKCDKFDIYLNEILCKYRKSFYILNIELYDKTYNDNKVNKLVEFYLDAFANDNDENIF